MQRMSRLHGAVLMLAMIAHASAKFESPAELSQHFAQYATKYAPDLKPGTSAFNHRMLVFEASSQIVDELNAAYPGAEFSLDNPFSHLTFDEFAARIPPMPRGGHDFTMNESALTDSISPPETQLTAFDWRKASVNAVTPVKDQGAMGSCWAFSTIGNIEGQRAIAGAGLEDLSVEQLIECDAQAGPGRDGETHSDCGVFGGWPYLAYQYLIKAGGVLADKEMPYCSGIQYGQPGNCLPCMVKGYNKSLCGDHSDLFCNASTTLGQGPANLCSDIPGNVAKLKGWRRSSQNATQIAADLVSTGPLSIALDATLAFQFYKKGILDPSSHPVLGGCAATTKPDQLNHAVLLVGFGTDGGKEYWTVKNSWGPKWGEDGFFRFVKGQNKCGIESEATTAILE